MYFLAEKRRARRYARRRAKESPNKKGRPNYGKSENRKIERGIRKDELEVASSCKMIGFFGFDSTWPAIAYATFERLMDEVGKGRTDERHEAPYIFARWN
ncbi:hypothetical protein TWF718_005120 [Orbilia javanica]|uniref:Uncharacterized protein n=1 Tax=Orbilia javanica TaxID=47235 RepID=A0AAN8RR49_9PEZI